MLLQGAIPLNAAPTEMGRHQPGDPRGSLGAAVPAESEAGTPSYHIAALT